MGLIVVFSSVCLFYKNHYGGSLNTFVITSESAVTVAVARWQLLASTVEQEGLTKALRTRTKGFERMVVALSGIGGGRVCRGVWRCMVG